MGALDHLADYIDTELDDVIVASLRHQLATIVNAPHLVVSQRTVCGTSAGSKVVVLGDDSIVAWSAWSITARGPGSVGTASMAFGWDASPVDYRDDELGVVGDGDDLGAVDLDDLRAD